MKEYGLYNMFYNITCNIIAPIVKCIVEESTGHKTFPTKKYIYPLFTKT